MMRSTGNKILIIFILLQGITTLFVNGQNPVDSIRAFLVQNDLPRAREAIDNYLLLQPEDVAGWLAKADIYYQLSSDPVYKDLSADGRMESFNSIKTAMNLNKEQVVFELKKSGFDLVKNLYNGYTNEGVTHFNAASDRKSSDGYSEALELFQKAALIGSYMYAQKWGGSKIDTINLYYSAKAAINSGKEDAAEELCRLIVDSGIVHTQLHSDFEPLYQWLVYHFRTLNKGEYLAKYTALSDYKYPGSSYFDINYSDWLREQKKYSLILTLYQGLFKRGLSNPELRFTYMQDIFNYLYNSDSNMVEGKEIWTTILERELTIASKFNPSNLRVKLLYAKFYINQAVDLQKLIKSNADDEKLVRDSRRSILQFIESSNGLLKEVCNMADTHNADVKKDALICLAGNYTFLGETQKAKKCQSQIAKIK